MGRKPSATKRDRCRLNLSFNSNNNDEKLVYEFLKTKTLTHEASQIVTAAVLQYVSSPTPRIEPVQQTRVDNKSIILHNENNSVQNNETKQNDVAQDTPSATQSGDTNTVNEGNQDEVDTGAIDMLFDMYGS